jgi:hypothetical protein
VPQSSSAFSGLGWNKPRSQFERYLSEQQKGIRTVEIAPRGSQRPQRHRPSRTTGGHRCLCGPRNSRKLENPYSHLSLLTWSNPAPRRNTPVDNSQNPTNKAKNRASQAAEEIFTFVYQSYT